MSAITTCAVSVDLGSLEADSTAARSAAESVGDCAVPAMRSITRLGDLIGDWHNIAAGNDSLALSNRRRCKIRYRGLYTTSNKTTGEHSCGTKLLHSDLSVIRINYGMTGATKADGDLNGDNILNEFDIDLAFAQYGLWMDLVA